jgi:purine nucleosidase/pyrimidine-specific ribonucleoside hydrolase
MSAAGPIPLIVDDDGSPDGMVALMYFLSNPLFEVKAVTISSGEAHPEIFALHVLRLLAGLGKANIPVGEGRATPLEGSNAFPDSWREASDNFWGIDYPEAPVSLEPVPAAQLIVDMVKNSPQPVMIFLSGTHTNLADALRLDASITGNIRAVYVMGGAINVPGNIKSDWPEIDNTVAEWNIWVDPVAAKEVFSSGLPVHLAPLDATDKVLWTKVDAQYWATSKLPEGIMAGKLLQWMMDSWQVQSFYIWDLVAAINATDERLCPESRLAVEILTTSGPEQGKIVRSPGSANITACLSPDAEQMRALAAGVLSP